MTQRTVNRSPAHNAPGHSPNIKRILDDARHDPYEARLKLREPTICKECGVVYRHGRWCWDVAPHDADRVLCPACQRAHDRMPAGYLTLEGPYVQAHRDDLLALAAKIEANEKAEHPMHRILTIEQEPESVTVHTSDIHLPHRIGEALCKAHRGHLDVAYGHNEYSVRAHWRG
jgi:hypothetical protein